LTDANFEEITMASSDLTHEIWLVNFCNMFQAKICKQLEPLWEEVASELYHQGISVGYVELDSEYQLKKKFSIGYQDIPFIALLKDTDYYRYEGIP